MSSSYEARNGWHDFDGRKRGPDEPFGPPLSLRPASILNTDTGEYVKALAADLTPFLDWPVCIVGDNACCRSERHPQCVADGYVDIANYGTYTVRDLLTSIKKHAEGK